MDEQNTKGQLISYCLQRQLQVKFDPVQQTGPSHDPTFSSIVYVNNELLGKDRRTKKMAEKQAASVALTTLHNREQLPEAPQANAALLELSAREAEHAISPKKHGLHPNYIGILNELSQKHKWTFAFLETDRRGPSHVPEFFCKAKIGDRNFPEARGQSKKGANKRAAYFALVELKREYPTEILLQAISTVAEACESGSESNSLSESTGDINSGQRALQSGSLLTSSNAVSIDTSSTIEPRTPVSPPNLISPLQYFDNISKLDSGAFGKVFKARKILDKKYYAVKKVSLKEKKSVLEVQALAQLEHPNIVRYFHSWTAEDHFSDCSYSTSASSETVSVQTCLFIQMELCEHGTLKTWIRARQTVDKTKVLEIFRQIVEGVAYIHSEKLIHRDLKPANLLFAKEMKVKIGDFGLATEITGEHEQALQRTQGTGTPSYMAPEQKNDTYENEVDIFPLGLILFELLYLMNESERAREWTKIRHAHLPDMFVRQNPYEETVIRRILSEDPKKRPTASDLKKIFEESHLDSKTL
ncbi:LOW QUALITY PROTEIN: interferon-induced, double-stranded RNA-activated protein kinase-like [Pelodytes ibericus]